MKTVFVTVISPLKMGRPYPFKLAAALALVLAPSLALGITAGQVDTFEDGALDGWTNGPSAVNPVNIVTGGPLGAGDHYLQVSSGSLTPTAPNTPRLIVFNQTQWVGNYTSALIQDIQMDLKNFGSATLSIRIAFRDLSGGTSTTPGYSSTTAFSLPADGQWHHADFFINAANLTGTHSPLPLTTVMNNVPDFRILSSTAPATIGDMISARIGIDNIAAFATPVAPQIATSPALAAVVAGTNATFTLTANGTPAPTYQWQFSADGGGNWTGASGSPYTGATTSTLTVTAPGTTLLGYQFRAIITNSAGNITTTPVPLVVGTSNAKLTWLQNNFSSAQLGQPRLIGDLATPANDGIPNLIKYAFNINPFLDGHGSLPEASVAGGNVGVSFTPRADLTYSVEASTDLISWSTASVTQTNGSQDTATYPIPAGDRAFLHIVITP